MSQSSAQKQQQKWNQRYQHSTTAGDPCWVLKQNSHLLPPHGKALDLACGLGANALYLARHGLETHGWDISTVALDKLGSMAQQNSLSVNTLQRDVEQHPPAKNSFDVIVVSQFLYRDIFPDLIDALNAGGLLFYQTFNQQKLSDQGPGSKEYLLSRNELLNQLSSLQLVFYREDSRVGNLNQGLRDCSYYVGQKII